VPIYPLVADPYASLTPAELAGFDIASACAPDDDEEEATNDDEDTEDDE
jgi:hypothetical protein